MRFLCKNSSCVVTCFVCLGLPFLAQAATFTSYQAMNVQANYCQRDIDTYQETYYSDSDSLYYSDGTIDAVARSTVAQGAHAVSHMQSVISDTALTVTGGAGASFVPFHENDDGSASATNSFFVDFVITQNTQFTLHAQLYVDEQTIFEGSDHCYVNFFLRNTNGVIFGEYLTNNGITDASINEAGTLTPGQYRLSVYVDAYATTLASYESGDYEIDFTLVPEPASLFLLTFGGMVCIWRRRNR